MVIFYNKDGVVMGLFSRKKQTNRNEMWDKDQEHMAKDGSFHWGWHTLNKDFTEKITNEYKYFCDNWQQTYGKSPKERYEALKSLVIYLQDAQKLCYSKNECFVHWFDGCIARPDYIAERISELNELETNLDKLQEDYLRRKKVLEELEEKIFIILKENDGIIQADLYKKFDSSVKNDISNLLYCLDRDGKIERIKSGRSYSLHIR